MSAKMALAFLSIEFSDMATAHIGLVSCIIRGLDSVLLFVVKVTKSYDSIGTMCNQFNMENRALLHKVLPDSALANFTTMVLHISQNFQNTT